MTVNDAVEKCLNEAHQRGFSPKEMSGFAHELIVVMYQCGEDLTEEVVDRLIEEVLF